MTHIYCSSLGTKLRKSSKEIILILVSSLLDVKSIMIDNFSSPSFNKETFGKLVYMIFALIPVRINSRRRSF